MVTGSLSEGLRETLAAFDEPGVPRTTPEVADRLDLGRRTAYARLERLVEAGRLDTKKVGANARVWWRPPSVDPPDPDWSAAAESLVGDVLDDVEVGLFVLDADFEVAWINEATERYFGLDREAVLGRDKRALVEAQIAPAVADSETFAETVLSTYDDNAGVEHFECRVTPGEGRAERWLEHRSNPIETGAYAGGRVELYYDVTERKRSERARRENREEFESLVETVEEYAIFTLDPEGEVRTWNPGAEQIKGFTAEDIVGDHFSRFYTEAEREAGVPERNLAAAARDGSVEDEGWRVRADGSRFWANVTITAIRDDDGDLTGFAKVTRDMTDRKRIEAVRDLLYETTSDIAEAETFEAGLQAALRDICAATDWEYGEAWLPTDEGTLRRSVADYHVDELAGRDAFPGANTLGPGEGHPGRVYASGESEWAADLPAGAREASPGLDAAVDAGLQSSLGVPVVADDEVVAVLSFAMRERREPDDWLVDLVSSVAAELGHFVVRRRAEDRMERERDLIERIFETVPVGIGVLTTDGEVVRANDRAPELLGLSPAGFEDSGPDDRAVYDADGEPVPPSDRVQRRVAESGDPIDDWQCQIEEPDGSRRWLSVSAAPLETSGDDVDHVVTVGEDVTQLKEQNERLERQLDDVQSELDEVFGRIDEAFFAVDEDWRFTYVNDRAADLVRLPPGEMLGARVWDVLHEVAEGRPRELAERAMETQEPVEFEFYSELLQIWVEVQCYPSETGLSAYVRDVTERKERERELELYETIVSTMEDGVYVLDEEFCFTKVNDAYVEMTGYDREELLGTHCSLVVDEDVVAESAETLEAIIADQVDSGTIEADVLRADGTRVRGESRFTAVSPGGERNLKLGVVRDVSERVERERELEESRRRYRTLVENFPNGLVLLFDEDLRYLTAGGELFGGLDFSTDELRGDLMADRLPDELYDRVEPAYSAVFDGEVREFELAYGDEVRRVRTFPVTDDDGEVFAGMAMSQDVTERKERERQLRDRVRQQEVVTDLGRRALEDRDLDALLAEAAELVAETLDNDYSKVLDLDPDAEELRLRQGVGWDDGLVGSATVSAVDDDSQAAYTLATEHPVVVADLDAETRFGGPDLLTSHDVSSGISTVIGPADDPWGILGTHDTDRTEFSEQDAAFVQTVANILASAIERRRHEETLVRQREQLAALNSLHEVAREVTLAVIEESTRENIEAAVCERLAASPSYDFAWIGEVDQSSRIVEPRSEAGVDGYLDGITVSVDPDDERSRGPTGRALLTGETQVTQDSFDDPRHDPWREHVEQYGFRSSVAVPITHEGTVYGVLNVYAERPHAFGGAEREVVEQLAEVVGHAIAAAERKRALMSDELVELDFRVEDAFAALDVPAEPDGRITLDHAVPVDDGEFLVYGTAETRDDVDAVRALVEAVPHWESVTVRSEGEPVGFEATLTDPPVLSVVASLGGTVRQAVIEDDEIRMTIHLAPSADVRRVIDAVEDAYPAAEMVGRRQVERERPDPGDVERHLATALTDRQRTALEAAFHAGFFAWPRDASGEAVADSLGVAPPTFHQHLRKAERKVFEAVLGASG